MSVALPKVSVVFGSVTPPQGDIIDLAVHLGCSTEVSSFDCLLQNFDKKYSPGGTYPINVGDDASISLGRDPNCPSVLTGKVEEIEPLSSANENYIRIKGRCSGEQLFRRLVNKSWDNVKGEVVVKYIIDNYTSLSHVRGGTELIEDTDTTYTHLEYEDTPVFDILKYIAETADKTGAIGYDFRVAPDGKFEFFPKNSKTSSVSLSERLEVSEYAKNIHRIKNKITIYGAPERPEPPDKDQWTEPTQDPPENWVAVSSDTTISRQTSPSKIGTYHVEASRLVYGTLDFYRSITSLNAHKGSCLKLWYYHNFPVDSIQVRLRAPDASNYFSANITSLGEIEWHPLEATTGKGSEYDPDSNPNGIWSKVGSPSWSDIQAIEFVVTRAGGVVVFHVDGIFFDKLRWKYVAEDSGSQTQYGLREKVETDEELHSNKECEYRAKALLDFLKGSIETLKVRSEVIDYGTTPILAADEIHVEIPNENIDSDYRDSSIEYRASGRDQTLEVELELSKEPLLLADFIYGFRKSIQKLDKYKASVTGSAVAAGGSGGGGGMSQHGNEWHDPDMALQSDFADHKARHENGGADEISVAGLSGELADPQPPKDHKDEHKSGGGDAFESTDLLEAVVKRIQESTPTTLTVGAIADGQYLKRSGTDLVGSALAGTVKTTLSFAVVGDVSVDTDVAPTILAPCALTIVKVKLVVKTAPTGAAIIVDVNKDGTTIFTNQANRPQIAISGTEGDSGTPDVTSLAEGDALTVDIDQIGSTIAGADLTIEVVCTQAVSFS